MASKRDPIAAAYRRVAILKSIVAAERTRAMSKPHDSRNVDLGLVEPDQPSRDAVSAIEASFDQIKVLLDHLALLHMAASFEDEAKARLDTVAGAARIAIQKSRERHGGWAAKLVRGADSYQSLRDIGEIIDLTASDRNSFNLIRSVRNKFGHGIPNAAPAITAESARNILAEALARIK